VVTEVAAATTNIELPLWEAATVDGTGLGKMSTRATEDELVAAGAALHVNVEGAPPQSRRCKRGRWWRRWQHWVQSLKWHHLRLAVANVRNGHGGGSVDCKHRFAAVGGCNGGWTRVRKDEYEGNGRRKHIGVQESAQAHNMLVVLSALVRIV